MVEKLHNTMNTPSFNKPSSLTLIHRWDEVIFLRRPIVGMKYNAPSFNKPSSLTLIHRWDEVIFLRRPIVGMKYNAKGHSPYFANSPEIHLKIYLD
jgi:hypothetical protein